MSGHGHDDETNAAIAEGIRIHGRRDGRHGLDKFYPHDADYLAGYAEGVEQAAAETPAEIIAATSVGVGHAADKFARKFIGYCARRGWEPSERAAAWYASGIMSEVELEAVALELECAEHAARAALAPLIDAAAVEDDQNDRATNEED